jgi:hypothetical protein
MPKCDGMLNIVYKSYKAIILDVVHILIIGKHIAYVHKFQINLNFFDNIYSPVVHIYRLYIVKVHVSIYDFSIGF